MFRKLLDEGRRAITSDASFAARSARTSSAVRCCSARLGHSAHSSSKAAAYVLTKEEGGRHTPFFTNYRPQFYLRTTDVTGVVELPQGTEMVMPGDNVDDRRLAHGVPIAMEEKLRFAIREGGRTVGSGVVVSITE